MKKYISFLFVFALAFMLILPIFATNDGTLPQDDGNGMITDESVTTIDTTTDRETTTKKTTTKNTTSKESTKEPLMSDDGTDIFIETQDEDIMLRTAVGIILAGLLATVLILSVVIRLPKRR